MGSDCAPLGSISRKPDRSAACHCPRCTKAVLQRATCDRAGSRCPDAGRQDQFMPHGGWEDIAPKRMAREKFTARRVSYLVGDCRPFNAMPLP
jgi:hypothetical protein